VLRVAGCDVVLEKDRNALERARFLVRRVELAGDRERIGIDLANGIEPRAGAIIGLDPRGIAPHQIGGRDAAGGKRALEVVDRRILDTHGFLRGGGRHEKSREQREAGPRHPATDWLHLASPTATMRSM
jgi:hypothetical protein